MSTNKSKSLTPDNLVDCFAEIEHAAKRLKNVAYKTPVMTSQSVNERCNAKVFMKCENLQRIGAFKFRGAYNAVSQLNEAQRLRGVITVSSGNHGQAIARVCQMLGIKATIVMPDDVPEIKRNAVAAFGANIVIFDRSKQKRDEMVDAIIAQENQVNIPAYEHPHIIAGQGTAGLELINEIKDLNTVLIPCGGGGLLAGSVIAIKSIAPDCRVIGVEPDLADDGVRSFKSGHIQTITNPQTIADGTRTESIGVLNFEIIKRYVDDLVSVSEHAIEEATAMLFYRGKIVVEPSGALGVAALLEKKVENPGKAGVIISGGNVDGAIFSEILRSVNVRSKT